MIESGFASIFVAAVLIVAVSLVVVGICAGVSAIYERGRAEGNRYSQQQAVDRGYGHWEVWQGDNIFQWNPKPKETGSN